MFDICKHYFQISNSSMEITIGTSQTFVHCWMLSSLISHRMGYSSCVQMRLNTKHASSRGCHVSTPPNYPHAIEPETYLINTNLNCVVSSQMYMVNRRYLDVMENGCKLPTSNINTGKDGLLHTADITIWNQLKQTNISLSVEEGECYTCLSCS